MLDTQSTVYTKFQNSCFCENKATVDYQHGSAATALKLRNMSLSPQINTTVG